MDSVVLALFECTYLYGKEETIIQEIHKFEFYCFLSKENVTFLSNLKAVSQEAVLADVKIGGFC